MNFHVSCDENEFIGKRILVTGGTKGISKAVADRLRRGGGIVLVTARNIPTVNDGKHFIKADVSSRAGADEVIRAVFDQCGGLDILINSLGGSSAPGGGAGVDGRGLAAGAGVEPILSGATRSWLFATNA